MRRVVVLGGLGLFGRTAAEQLRRLGMAVQTATRGSGADLRVDANDADSIQATLREGDLVVDAAGPFQARSTALIEAAIDVGFDIVDLNDSLTYAEHVLALEQRIAGAGIRMLSAASTVSAVAAAVLRRCGKVAPHRVTTFLAPATRHTANAGTALSLVESVGRPVRVWRDGRMEERIGWSEPRSFPMPPPVGPVRGWLVESADALQLPRIWPSLRDVAMHVDANTPGFNFALRIAAGIPGFRRILASQMQIGTWVARKLGASVGGIGYEIEDANGRMVRYAIVGRVNSQLVAVAPAVLASQAIIEGRFEHRGLVRPDCHVDPAALFAFLESSGITFTELV